MSQTFNVVRCFQCGVFQVDINKTSTNKWSCKMCGSKQSLKQVYFQGDSKDCRDHVKALNEKRHELDDQKGNQALNQVNRYHQDEEYYEKSSTNNVRPIVSRWAKYIQHEDDDDNDN